MKLLQKFENLINPSPIISYGKKIVSKALHSVEGFISTRDIFKELKRIFSPVTPPFKPPIPSLGDVLPPTIWNNSIRKVINPIGRVSRPTLFSLRTKQSGLPLKTTTFGVPPSYLAPTTLAGKQYVSNPDELFRFFKIADVGHVQIASNSSMWHFKFVSDRSKFRSYFQKIALDAGLIYCTGWDFPVKFVLQTDEFTFSFSNSYGDTFLEQFNNIISGTARQLVYLTNQSLTNNVSQIANLFKQMAKSNNYFVKGLGSMLTSASNAIGSLSNWVEQQGQNFQSLNTMLHQLNWGHKILFPKIWQGSNFSNSYTIRTSLYALSDDEQEVQHYVLAPLLILILLSTPISDNEYFYTFPFIFKGEIEGVREIEAGAITDLRISLGGERSFYNIEKKYLAIDVEFTVSDLYDVMVSSLTSSKDALVPTTSKWFKYITKYISKDIS